MLDEPSVSHGEVGALLIRTWQMDVASIEYEPIGYGSYHWRVMAKDGSRWFVTLDRIDARPIFDAYEIAQRLATDLEFVRGPLPTCDGQPATRVDGWWMSVWPWVDGRTGTFASARSAADLEAVVRCLRRLHDHRVVVRSNVLTEDWLIPGRFRLAELLEPGRRDRDHGPYSAEVLARLETNGSTVRGWLARYDELVDTVAAVAAVVLTHGEPHPGNVVMTDSGPKLIDWDTVRWAPRERDLWALGDGDWRSAYGEDATPSAEVLEVYRLQWTLVDVADFVPLLVEATTATADLEIAMNATRGYLRTVGDAE